MAEILTFKPKIVAKKLLQTLPEKAQDVLKKRFGLDDDAERMTLEAIGGTYGITRERVRQIENFALQSLKKSDAFKESGPVFDELRDRIHKYGRGIAHEEHFLNHISIDNSTKNHIHFFLVLGEPFTRLKEDDRFYQRWTTDVELADKIHGALQALEKNLNENDLLKEEEIISSFFNHLKREEKNLKIEDMDVVKRWLVLSKSISQNPLGDWGVVTSPNIRVRGMRDLAFLVLRRHGKPLHFSDVAKEISNRFGRPAHVATCHNELIKDDRFVLVGRGLYALSQWGYSRGTVRDIIKSILERQGPLTKAEIVNMVAKERYVKESTISVNLQNGKFFKRSSEGRYSVAE
jgi:hypothetical protein